MEFADEAGAVTDRFEGADEVGGGFVVESEFPGGEADLAVLVGVEAGEEGSARLRAAGLGHVGALEENAL